MTCPNCRTLSCYVCRQVVTGYEHFDQVCLHVNFSSTRTIYFVQRRPIVDSFPNPFCFCCFCFDIISNMIPLQQQRGPGQPSTSTAGSKKCLLWDKVEERHVAEVCTYFPFHLFQ